MSDNKGGDITKKHQHLTTPSSSSPKDHVQESTTDSVQEQQSSAVLVTGGGPFISPPPPLYLPTEQQQQFELGLTNPKRPRYTPGQWKLLPSPSPSKQQKHLSQLNIVMSGESTPSPSTHATAQLQPAAASSSETTASSPSHSPRPSLSGSAASGQDGGDQLHQQLQFRKGKYVSPVWKPNEMLWLARAWRVQYQGAGAAAAAGGTSDQPPHEGGAPVTGRSDVAGLQLGRGNKTRADKDREVADFLNSNGVNRDAKTAGTKWDNMLGEFRKVYEWERGGERDQIGKSYFRLSPYERKLHRLPASFDEEVFEELSQFMGSRMRTPQSRSGASSAPAFISGLGDDSRSTLMAISKPFPPPPSFRDDDQPPLSGNINILVWYHLNFLFN